MVAPHAHGKEVTCCSCVHGVTNCGAQGTVHVDCNFWFIPIKGVKQQTHIIRNNYRNIQTQKSFQFQLLTQITQIFQVIKSNKNLRYKILANEIYSQFFITYSNQENLILNYKNHIHNIVTKAHGSTNNFAARTLGKNTTTT